MITKSQYLVGQRCVKALWLNKHKENNLQDNNDDRARIGIEVGVVARGLFPGGIFIKYNESNIYAMVEDTKEAMKSNDIIYEATFIYNDILVRCDIIKKTDNGWEIYEVKSTTDIYEKKIRL